eukprot:m.717969 g.717969  ORF g.717969 m.717969 type:complete len:86 (+) comp22990_c0_seq9:3-260(+)
MPCVFCVASPASSTCSFAVRVDKNLHDKFNVSKFNVSLNPLSSAETPLRGAPAGRMHNCSIGIERLRFSSTPFADFRKQAKMSST